MADPKLVPVEMLVAMASEKNDRDIGAIVYVSEAERERLFNAGFACEPSGSSAASSPAKRGRKPSAPAEKAEE